MDFPFLPLVVFERNCCEIHCEALVGPHVFFEKHNWLKRGVPTLCRALIVCTSLDGDVGLCEVAGLYSVQLDRKTLLEVKFGSLVLMRHRVADVLSSSNPERK